MTQNNKCLVCSEEKNLIPAGTSKRTGKAYQAFWACPNKCKISYKSAQVATDVPVEANSASNVALNAIMARFDDLEERIDALSVDIGSIKTDLTNRP